MSTAIQITPWGFVSSNPRSLGRVRGGDAGFDRLFPGEGLTGGEGGGVWEFHWFQAHLRVVLGCGEGLGGSGSTEQGGSAAEENDGGGAPVRIGRGEVVGKVCEGDTEMLVVLV